MGLVCIGKQACASKYSNPLLLPHAAMHMLRSLCLFVAPEDMKEIACVLIGASVFAVLTQLC